MSLIQRLLLMLCLAPLLAVMVVSTLHGESSTRLRLLIWTSPMLPIGAWTALAAGGGAMAAAASAVLLQPSARPLRRTRHTSYAPEQRDPPTAPPHPVADPEPQRDLRDPAPTVSVAYRVIQRPAQAKSGPQAPSRPQPQSPSVDESNWGKDPDRDW